MLETLGRITTSKGYYWFWFAFTVAFFVLDVFTGSFIAAALMLLLAVFWGYTLKKTYDGNNVAHNRYHSAVGK